MAGRIGIFDSKRAELASSIVSCHVSSKPCPQVQRILKEQQRMKRLDQRAKRRAQGDVIRPQRVAPGFSDGHPDIRDVRLRGFDALHSIFPDVSKETLIQALLDVQDMPCSERAAKACVKLLASGKVQMASPSKLTRARSESPVENNHKKSDDIPSKVPSAPPLTRSVTQPVHDSPQAYLGMFGADAASLLFVEMLNPASCQKVQNDSDQVHFTSELGGGIRHCCLSGWKYSQKEATQDEISTLVSERSRKRAGKKFARDLRKYKRSHVDPRLLYAAPPSEEILMALDNAKSAAAAVAAANAELDANLEKNSKVSQCPWNSWDALQKKFMDEHEQSIRKELGEAVEFSPVHPANEQEFLLSCHQASSMPLPAYHGTRSKNIESISARGLLIPGHGGVCVANGSAHGMGIYTAKLGASYLSKSFCDSDKLFICGVCDGAEETGHNSLKPKVLPLAKWTSGLSLHHRQHRAPQTAQLARQNAFKMLGNFRLHKDTGSVRHVGNAMVVFDEARVAPLFLAQGVSGCGRGIAWPNMNVTNHVKNLLTLWPSGIPVNPNRSQHPWKANLKVGRQRTLIKETLEVVWLPPEPTGDRDDVRAKRRVEGKRKKVRRCWERDEKLKAQSLHSEIT
eukprot:gnl/MRDRNA2_/MRDRNA2_103225_c0_seq1.p1 gnl/MRDRNA2_/MRDRNA2_103225_c0~~gnl/MRDRNA2_/MRDRNA2_103225_c0_seq1.p1  ORF type:complete len:626 (+),score=126.20 gnl/MRDRNA2_/MRDRNA2_103225_c0_seq1:79-1956(+)